MARHDWSTPGPRSVRLEAGYVDKQAPGTSLPSFDTVKVGLRPGHRLVFVPLEPGDRGAADTSRSPPTRSGKDAPSLGPTASLARGRRTCDLQALRLTYGQSLA